MTSNTTQTSQAQLNTRLESNRLESNRIKKLPPLLVNQLAAGEVVTRPASVVKELMENAIDAGASEIIIKITQGGMGLIEVCDNGCGIHPDDMVMAVTRFATSKIADVAHLQGISTLGFRGEALAATAAVSRLTIKSSCDDSGIGRELTVAGILEDTPSLIPVVQPQGTTVTVKDLYFNVPARRGNLKSISTEFNHIESVVKQLALVASDIDISLWHNDRRRFYFESIRPKSEGYCTTTKTPLETAKGMMSRLQIILPSLASQSDSTFEAMVEPINIALEGLAPQVDSAQICHISGLIMPQAKGFTSATLNLKLIYINGRLVKDKQIAQCLRECVASFQPNNTETILNELGYVLFFQLPHSWLNLNVHPSKRCIKIQNLANITAHLKVGVRDGLQTWVNKQTTKSTQANLEYENRVRKKSDRNESDKNEPDRKKQAGEKYPYLKGFDATYSNATYSNNSMSSGSVSEKPQRYQLSNINDSFNKVRYSTYNDITAPTNNLLLKNLQQLHIPSSRLPSEKSIKSDSLISCLAILEDARDLKGLLNDSGLSKLSKRYSFEEGALVLIQVNNSLLLMSEFRLFTYWHKNIDPILDNTVHGGTDNLAHYLSINNIKFPNDYLCLDVDEKLDYLNTSFMQHLTAEENDNAHEYLKKFAVVRMNYKEVMVALLKQVFSNKKLSE